MTPEGAPLFTQGSGLDEEFEELVKEMGDKEKVSMPLVSWAGVFEGVGGWGGRGWKGWGRGGERVEGMGFG